MDRLCYLCFVFVILSRLFIAVVTCLEMAELLALFVTFPCGILGQV